MADIKPFRAVRPKKEKAVRTTAMSYEEVLAAMQSGELYQYHAAGYFIYEMKSEERVQTGIVACASIDDYVKQVIRNHEAFMDETDDEKVSRIECDNTQTEPVVLAYHDQRYIKKMIGLQEEKAPIYHFSTPDGVEHTVWSVDDFSKVKNFMDAFDGISDIYVVSGHAAAASAVEVGLKRRAEKKNCGGAEEADSFVCVLLPYSEIKEDGAWVLPKLQKNLFCHAI